MAKYKIIPSSRNIVQSPISIGHKAEKGVEAIEFDVTAWVETYGSGTLTVIMRRWGDAIPYPIALEIDENNKATWTLSDIDTAKAGMAYAQLSYIVGETVVKKSDIYTFRVMDSLTGEGEPPEAYESWLENLTHLAAEAMAEVLDIEGVATDKTLTVDGGIADAKATGEALAEKVDAADYSALSARVGANTIALAEKADRSTTYTKAQVDQMISDVEVETDTTLAIPGAPADAKKVGDELSDIKADLAYDKSVLDNISNEQYTEAVGLDESSKAINKNAQIVDAVSTWHVITFNVVTGDAFRITATAINQGYWYIFTDGTNVIKKSGKSPASEAVITDEFVLTPSNASSLIVCYNAAKPHKVNKITGNVVVGLDTLDNRIDTLEELTTDVTIDGNVPTSDIIIHDEYYIGITGNDAGPYTNWQYAEYVIPQDFVALTVTAKAGQNARLWVLKDSSNDVIAYSDYSGSVQIFSETIILSNYPNAARIFVNDNKSGHLSISYNRTKNAIDGEEVYIDGKSLPSILEENGSDLLYGKTLCCVGDSITYGADMDAEGITDESNITVYNCDVSGNFTQTVSHFLKTWGWQIANRHNMTFYNGGVSGSTMQGLTDKNGFSLANGRYTKLPDSIDYLVIWFGWNDTAYGTLGAITDITNESYYGGYNVVLPYLIDKYPYTKIALIVPFGTDVGHRNAIRQLGNKWGVAVWDNYQGGTPLYYGKEDGVGVEQSVVTANRAKFQANGAHPNHRGHKQLADMIEEFLRGI